MKKSVIKEAEVLRGNLGMFVYHEEAEGILGNLGFLFI